MINLLPPLEKLLLRFERNKRLVLVWGIMTLTSLVSFALILLIVQFAVWDEINLQEVYLTQIEEQSKNDNFPIFKNVIQRHNKNVTAVYDFYSTAAPFAPVLETLSEIDRPGGVVVTNIKLAQNETGDTAKTQQVEVVMSGTSARREDLLAFKLSIEQNSAVANVYFPPKNWIKSSQIDFSVTFNVKY